jgi:hypothetical protein
MNGTSQLTPSFFPISRHFLFWDFGAVIMNFSEESEHVMQLSQVRGQDSFTPLVSQRSFLSFDTHSQFTISFLSIIKSNGESKHPSDVGGSLGFRDTFNDGLVLGIEEG